MGDTYNIGNVTGPLNAGRQDQRSTPQMPPIANSSTPVTWNDVRAILDSVEDKDGSKLVGINTLLTHSTIKELTCTITTSHLSIEVEVLSSFPLQYFVKEVGPNCVLGSQLSRFPIEEHVKALDGNCLYKVTLDVIKTRRNGVSELINYFISAIYPQYEGIQKFMKIVEWVALYLYADPTAAEFPEITFVISYACSDVFCEAIKTLSFENLGPTRLECFHSQNDHAKLHPRTECTVEQMGSELLSKPNLNVTCFVRHQLREDQLSEFLLKEFEEKDSSLQLHYIKNEIHEKFFKNKRNKKQLKNVNVIRAADKLVIALRPGNTPIQRALAKKITTDARAAAAAANQDEDSTNRCPTM